MPKSESSSSGLFSTEEIHATVFIGAAAAQILKCSHVAIQGGGPQGDEEERRRGMADVLSKIDPMTGAGVSAELATVMYEAACSYLSSCNLAYPPLEPATFIGLGKHSPAGAKEEAVQS